MGLLRDVRSKVDPTTYAAIQSEMAARKMTESEVIRGVLDPWGRQRLHAAKVMQAHMLREDGIGQARENGGTAK